jgi:hypothetical protein
MNNLQNFNTGKQQGFPLRSQDCAVSHSSDVQLAVVRTACSSESHIFVQKIVTSNLSSF